jgi:hypothetical protein
MTIDTPRFYGWLPRAWVETDKLRGAVRDLARGALEANTG